MSRVADALCAAQQRAGDLAAPAESTVVDVWGIQADAPPVEPAPALRPVEARYQGPAGGEFAELVQRIFRPGAADPAARLVTFVEVGSGESRRPVALEVAAALAAHGVGSVCVVDASFGAAALHERAGLPPGPGLCDALLNSAPVGSMVVPLQPRLALLAAGEQMVSTQAWMPEAMARVMRQLSGRFDFVVVEAAPVARGSNVASLLTTASLTDGVVFVLEAARTRRDMAQDVAERLRAAGVSLLGAVLAGAPPSAGGAVGGRR